MPLIKIEIEGTETTSSEYPKPSGTHFNDKGEEIPTYDYEELKTQARDIATTIVLNEIEKRWKKNKKSSFSKIAVKPQAHKSNASTFLITYTFRERWVRYRLIVYIDKATISESWAAQIEIQLDDTKNLLIPRSRISEKRKAIRIEAYDFADKFNNEFWKIISYYQKVAELDWTQVSLFDLLYAKADNFLKKLGITK